MEKNCILKVLLDTKGIGNITARKIFDRILVCFDTSNDYISELSKQLVKYGVSKLDIENRIYTNRKVLMEYEESGISIVNYTDPLYPIKLLQLEDFPVILYYKGNINILNESVSIGIIGTRTPTPYGIEITKKFTSFIAKRNIVIVSGLAKGIDREAHLETVAIKRQTIAFIAQGLNTPLSPKQNRELAQEILENGGALISEYPPFMKPRPNFFVERDRLQAGVSDAILVIESTVKSGTMHAVNTMKKLDRKVGALMHPNKFSNNNIYSEGNRYLFDNEIATPVFSELSLIEFITDAEKYDSCFKIPLDFKLPIITQMKFDL